MVRAEHAGRLSIDGRPEHSECLTVAGVPLDEGFLPMIFSSEMCGGVVRHIDVVGLQATSFADIRRSTASD